MNKLIAIGEILIDFTGTKTGNLSTVKEFSKNPGGAPANVSVCVSKMGCEAVFLTMLGKDAFGDYLIRVLDENGVDTKYIKRTGYANTPLAFVTLDHEGEREFAFYRNPSSDLFYSESDVPTDIFKKGDILHFGSVNLVDYPIRGAHRAAIKYALQSGCIISFDPNLRFSLWNSENELIKIVKEFIPYAHIVKVSEEEILCITGISDEAEAAHSLFEGNVGSVIVTKGKHGAALYTKSGGKIEVAGVKTKQLDATGAGDVFTGVFLSNILREGITVDNFSEIREDLLLKWLKSANKGAAISVSRKGAIDSIPDKTEVF